MTALLERIAVVGANGQLGRDLMRAFADRAPVGLEHRFVDLEDPASLAAMLARYRPTLVVNTAAYHQVELCEVHPERAFAVNALGVDALAGACALAGAALVHVSTDYVFAGDATQPYDERDAAQPVNVYGASKLAGELLVRRHGERHFIVRTSGLYGRAGSSTKGYTFIERVLQQAERGEPVRVVDDIVFSPSYTLHVAQAIRRIVESGAFGTYHATNAGLCSWYEFAREAFALAGLEPDFEAIKYDGYNTYVKRPRFSALEHGEISRQGIAPVPDWREGLRAYLAERT